MARQRINQEIAPKPQVKQAEKELCRKIAALKTAVIPAVLSSEKVTIY